MERFAFFAFLIFVSSVSAQDFEFPPIIRGFSQFEFEKPISLPITASVGLDCPVGEGIVRDSAEQTLERDGIEPRPWPQISGDKPWFGVLIQIRCKLGTASTASEMWFDVSFIDSIDNQLQPYGHISTHFSYGGNRVNGFEHEGAITKARLPEWVSNITRDTVEKFLREYFVQ